MGIGFYNLLLPIPTHIKKGDIEGGYKMRTIEELLEIEPKCVRKLNDLKSFRTRTEGIIQWSKAPLRQITSEEYNTLLNYLRDNAYEVPTTTKSNKNTICGWTDMMMQRKRKISYKIDHNIGRTNSHTIVDNGYTIYLCDAQYNFLRLMWKPSNDDVDKQDKFGTHTGRNAYLTVDNMFKAYYGKSLKSGFGVLECGSDLFNKFKFLQMPRPYYLNTSFIKRTLKSVYKGDVSAAFPFELCFSLPDAHIRTSKLLDGRVEPTPEYPFAFYLNSHHIKIYNELDTRDIERSKIYLDFCEYHRLDGSALSTEFKNIPDSKEQTLLMKASTYSLKEIMEELYNKRKEDEDAKTVMNAFIGFLQSTKTNWFQNAAHISAVVYARHWAYMSKLYNSIRNNGGTPLQIQVDSIIWVGKPIKEAAQQKTFGCFHSEYENVLFRQKSIGVYAFEINGQIMGVRHQGTLKTDLKPIKKLEDIDTLTIYKPVPTEGGEIIYEEQI